MRAVAGLLSQAWGRGRHFPGGADAPLWTGEGEANREWQQVLINDG